MEVEDTLATNQLAVCGSIGEKSKRSRTDKLASVRVDASEISQCEGRGC